MIPLPNGCERSEISVYPKNWNKSGASVKEDWYIHYTFYPASREQYKYGILRIVKGMNKQKTLDERRVITKSLLKELSVMLDEEGYNPITKKYTATADDSNDIEPTTMWMIACIRALERLKCADSTKRDIKSALSFIDKSAVALSLQGLQIQHIRRKHISRILDNCKSIKEHWSPHLFNHYRAYLMIVFKKLVELEAIEFNPVDEHLPKEIVPLKLRKLPTNEEVKLILGRFRDDHYFMRFFQIFFHSGDRPIELTRLTTADVDMRTENYIKLDRKGNKIRLKEKPIKRAALPYWQDLMNEVMPGQFLFGPKLIPGDKPAPRDYITKKWNREIISPKTGLGINVNLYTFKHKNLDEIAAYLSIVEAQRAAGHESKVITMTYAVNEKQRENDRLRDVPNVLGG